jgi:hypothetical protein
MKMAGGGGSYASPIPLPSSTSLTHLHAAIYLNPLSGVDT